MMMLNEKNYGKVAVGRDDEGEKRENKKDFVLFLFL